VGNLVRVKPLAQSPVGVADRNDPRWVRLRDQIQTDSLQRGTFQLASGRSSNFLFQLRQTTLHPEGAALLSDIIIDYMHDHNIKYIGGLIQGAVPIATSVAARSYGSSSPIFAFFVRKEAKLHGAKERIDGYYGKDNEEVLIVDDVATSGGSLLKAIDALREEGHSRIVKKALVIVDREEGAAKNLSDKGIELISLFKKRDFDI